MLKLNYFLADIFILSAEKQPIKLSWRKIEWLRKQHGFQEFMETLSKGGSFQVHLSCPGKVQTCCRHRQRRRGGMVCGTNWAVVSDRG